MSHKTNKDYIEKRFLIRNKRGELVPFILNKAQQYYQEKRTRRNLILKARQKGLSKFIDADQLVDCIHKPTNAVVISHEREATQRLFGAVRGFTETMKVRPVISIDSKSEIRFPKKGSSYFIGTAGQKAFGRGDTVDRAHLSEAAFYDDLQRILNGIAEAAEYGQIDIETTPNGREQFYDMWQKAKAGLSSYTTIFIPWFIDDEYSVDNMTEEERQGMSAAVQEMIAIPDEEFVKDLTEEEQRLIARVKTEWNIELTAGMMKWRRYKIWDKGQMFFQEYPEDDVSCFLQSGRTVFSQVILDARRRIPLDNYDVWATGQGMKPEAIEQFKKKLLYGGVDGAEGTPTGDQHVFAVIDVDIETGKAAPIFEITSNEPIDIFWQKAKKITDEFNIWLGIEKNGVGVAHVQKARQLNIRFIEWETTATTRPVMITDLEEAYRKGELIETYPAAENELRDMEYGENNRPDHKKGKHDDRVFARAVAWQMRKRPRPGVTFL
jgi:hypothetical protein